MRLGTVTQNIDLALTDQQTPLTVANFVAYINSGAFANNFIHRSVPGFVIQGGGFFFMNDTTFNLVPAFAPVMNEPGLSNVRGTIAMAKLGGDPNSATSEWFINLADNSADLDGQNGGFTVFGRVVGNGMAVADEVAALTTYDASSLQPAWTDLPLDGYDPDVGLTRTDFVETNASIIPALTFAASSGNSTLVTPTVSGSTLQITPVANAIGNTTVTVTATDLDGATLQVSFAVNVLDTYANWQAAQSFANPADAAATADPDHDGVPNLQEYAFGGDPLHSDIAPGAPQPEAGGGVTFRHLRDTALNYEVDTSTDLQTWTRVWQTSDGFAQPVVFARTPGATFDTVTIRPSGAAGPRRFWRVVVTPTL